MLKETKSSYYHYFLDDNDHLQGEYKQWWDNGRLRFHICYHNGVYHGEFKEWYDNGQISEYHFYSNGKRHGEFKSWWAEGTVHSRTFYADNQEILFDELPCLDTPEDRMYFMLKYNIPLLPVELVC